MTLVSPRQGCLVTAPDYDSLQLVYTARRLFQPDDVMPLPAQKQDMNRRFAEGYKILAQVSHLQVKLVLIGFGTVAISWTSISPGYC